MEKYFHKDNLEEYFRKSLAGLGEKPSQDDWDMPSDQVWENIEKGIPIHPAPKGVTSIPKLKWFLALIALLLLLISYQLYTYDKKLNVIAGQVRENKRVMDALKKERKEEDVIALVDDAKKIGAQKSNSADAEELLIGTAFPRKEKSGITPSVSVQRQEMDYPEKNSNPKNVSTKRSHSEVDNSVELQNPSFANDLDENRGSSARKDHAQNGGEERGDMLKKEATSNAIVEVIGDKGEGGLKLESKPPILNFSTANNPAVAESPLAPISAIMPLGLKTIFLEKDPLPLANRNIPDDGMAGEKKENVHPQRLSLGLYFSPTYSYRSLTSKISGATQSFDEEASGKLSYNLGIQLGYNLQSRWTIYSGLKYHNLNQTSLHRIGLRYTRVGGSIENGRFVNAYDAELKTSFGDAKIGRAHLNSSHSGESRMPSSA